MKAFKFFFVFLFLANFMVISSCNSNEELTPIEMFGGNFSGLVSYSDGENEIQNEGASVQVIQDGDFWSFHFSDGIPAIDSIEFEIGQDGRVMMNREATPERLIRITSRTLQIVYTVENQSWNANCSRN